jgi:3-deoxy-D-manno-octulosonate 8-phosphate phosphatase (KDO 8-P phosphatase)
MTPPEGDAKTKLHHYALYDVRQRARSSNARIAAMPKKRSAQALAKNVKLLLFDVDGVLTDGKLFIFPVTMRERQKQQDSGKRDSPGGFDLNSQSIVEAMGFDAHDGTSLSLARLGGLKTGLITKRISETVALRARELKLEHVHQGVQDKRSCLQGILKKENLKFHEAAFVGDDIIDLPAMRAAGLAIAVQNARADVKREAHYVTPHSGGDGALRDAVEFILKAQGKWQQVRAAYIGERSSKSGI